MRYTIRWRYVLKLTAVVAAAAVAVFFVHRWQADKQQGAFLRQADKAKAADEPAAEAKFLRMYLAANPKDVDARERYGRLMLAAAKTRAELAEAYLVLDDALRRDPDRDDLRRFAVETAMSPRFGLYPEALAHLDNHLVRQHPEDGQLEALAARCLSATGKYDEAAKRYQRAIDKRPDLVEAYAGLAGLYRFRLNRAEDADGVIAGLLAANPASGKAALTAAEYWRTAGGRGQPAGAVAKALAAAQKLPPGETVGGAVGRLVGAARALAPDDLDVLLLSAVDLQNRAREAGPGKREEANRAVGEARELLARAIKLHPKAAGPYLVLANLEAAAGSPAEAAAVAGRGAAAVPDSVQLVDALLDNQIRAGDAAGADQTLAKLKAAGYPEVGVVVQRARIQGLRDEWTAAAAALAGLIARNPPELSDPAFARQVYLNYGRCCEQTGEHDRRLDAFRKAVPPDPADPTWVPAQVGVADALVALDKKDEALTAFRRLRGLAPQVLLPIARLELAKVLKEPDTKKRDWAAVEEAVGQAEKTFPDSTEVALLRSDVLLLRGDPAAARKVIDDLVTDRPKEPAVWVAAALHDLRDRNPDRAANTLDAAAEAAGDAAELRLARAQVYAVAQVPDLGEKLGKLADGGEALGKAAHRRLLGGLAEVAAAGGQPEVAARLLDRAAAVQGYNLGVHLGRYDMAVRAGDEAGMDRVAADIRRVDGPDGVYARLVTGLTAIWRAQKKNDPSGLAAARAALEAVEKDRPDWARAALALAVVLDLEKNPDAALTKYQKAVDGGEKNPDAALRLANLLFAKGKLDQAEAVFKTLPPGYADRPEVAVLAANLTVRTDPVKALAAAERAVPADSKEYKEQLWLGQIAWAAKDPVKAEAALRRAAGLRPDLTVPWLTLVRVLATAGRKADARLVAAEAAGKVDPAERVLFAALAAANVGDAEAAVERFRAAREERPADLRAVQGEAQYLFELGRLADARKGFERVLALKDTSPDEKAFATRMLAVCLAADRNPETSREALKLLGLLDGDRLKPPPADETPAQRRARATILALQKDRASKLLAIGLLEQQGITTLDPPDLFLLAQLHQTVGNRSQVRVAMSALLQKADTVPLYVANYAGWLLRDGDPDAAEPWVRRLAELQPDALQTAELRARLYAARKNPGEARKVLLAQAERPNAPAGLVAALFEEVGLYDDAERQYRRAADGAKAAGPAAVLPVARFLGRRGRTGEALAACDEARAGKVPAPEWGEAAVAALYAAKAPTPDEIGRVAGWLEAAAATADPPTKAALEQMLGSVSNLQGDYAKSMDLYRRAVAANDRDAVALNNLAYLVSAKDGRHDEGLKLVERARRVAGPVPDLLDTEALIRLQMGQPEAAVDLLKVVTAEAPTGTAYFHLAQAELAAGRKPEAVAAWRQAAQLGLTPADLHPLERAEFDRLAGVLK